MESSLLSSLGDKQKVVLVGGTGGIGAVLIAHFESCADVAAVHVLARRMPQNFPNRFKFYKADITDETAIEGAAFSIGGEIDLVFVATGILHGLSDKGSFGPEKTWRSFDGEIAQTVFAVNTIGPMLIAKHFLPLLKRDSKSVFAAISARVGSISDNAMGGWYSYRASKAALNQLIRSSAVELARKNKNAICVALHPGTVDTALSAPFQGNVKPGKLFTPPQSAEAMLRVIDGLTPHESGRLFAWDGTEIAP